MKGDVWRVFMQTPEVFEVDGAAGSTTATASENTQLLKGWRVSDGSLSLPEVNGSIKCPDVAGSWYAKAAAFAGLGGMIAVGYMDPGNWYVLHSSQAVLLTAADKLVHMN
jgi:hypothetical protein